MLQPLTNCGFGIQRKLLLFGFTARFSSAKAFRYSPLDDTRREIRLIRLDKELHPKECEIAEGFQGKHVAPPTTEKSLNIIMKTFPLDEAPPFTCLSYVWGTPERQRSIMISGKEVHVTTNLRKALRALTIRPGWFWADAICINQEDITERNSQVQLMTSMYSSAREVIAHLGDPEGDEGLLAIIALQQACEYLLNLGVDFSDGTVPSFVWESGDALIFVLNLLTCPWYTRAWIMQEAIVNKNTHLLYGNATMPIEILSSFVECIQRNLSGWGKLATMGGARTSIQDSAHFGRSFLQLDSIGRLRVYYHNKVQVPPDRALAFCRGAEATDARDMVYSLLFLMGEDVRQNIIPNYAPANTTNRVFINAAITMLGTSYSIELLHHAGHSIDDLPSWTPDWSSYPRSPLPHHLYNCSGDSQPCVDTAISSQGRIMIRGATVDEILDVLPGCGFSFSDDGILFEGQKSDAKPIRNYAKVVIVDMIFARAAIKEYSNNPYPTGERLGDVIWRTLTCDHSVSTHERADRTKGRKDYALFTSCRASFQGGIEPTEGVDVADLRSEAAKYPDNLIDKHGGRRGAITKKRYMALLPNEAVPGDLVAVFLGGRTPFILRPVENGEYRLIGEAYVHGIMDGELMSLDENTGEYLIEGRASEFITLI